MFNQWINKSAVLKKIYSLCHAPSFYPSFLLQCWLQEGEKFAKKVSKLVDDHEVSINYDMNCLVCHRKQPLVHLSTIINSWIDKFITLRNCWKFFFTAVVWLFFCMFVLLVCLQCWFFIVDWQNQDLNWDPCYYVVIFL